MARKVHFLLLYTLILAQFSVASPRGRQEIVKAGSWVYDAMVAIAMEEGHTTFSEQAPLTIQELELYLKETNYDSLSAAGKTYYNRIADYIANGAWTISSGILSMGIEPEANVEGYAKTNSNIDWVYDRYSKKPLLLAPFSIMAGDLCTLSMDLALQENKSAMQNHDNHTNLPFPFVTDNDIDANFPTTAYGSVGTLITENTGVNFQLGMAQQAVGRTLMGSIILNDTLTSTSYANLSAFSPNIRYNMNVSQLNVDKYMYTHRFDVRFFKKVQFTAMESMLVYAPLELRFLNPLTIFHGTSAWEEYEDHETNVCDYMAFKLSFTPVKYLRIYGLFAQDQWQTFYERATWPDDTTPNAISFQAGIESYIPYKNGYFHAWLEGMYTDPFMYIKEGPDWSLCHTVLDNVGEQAIFYEWVGSPFGSDTIAAELNIGYEVPGSWFIRLNYLFKASGEYSGLRPFAGTGWDGRKRSSSNATIWVYPNPDAQGQDEDEAKRRQGLIAPSGTVEYTNRIALRAGYAPTEYLSFALQPALVLISNHNNKSGDFAFGFECALTSHIQISRMHK